MQKVLKFCKDHRRALAGAVLVFFLCAVFAAVWLTHIRGQGDKSSSWAINDQFHSFAVIEEKMEQRFTCDRDLLALSLVLAAEDVDTPPEGELELILTDSATGEELARSTGDMRYIYNGWEAYYTTLGLDRFVENPGQAVEYTLTLIPHYSGEGRLCVGYEEGGMPAGVSLTVDGEEVDGTVALLGTQARVGGFLTKFYWIFAAGCIAAAALLWWMYCRGTALHRVVFCAVLLLGFAFNVLLPPYAAPDEKYHINQSFTLASTLYDPHLPVAKSHIRDTIRRPSDQDALIQVDETTVFTWQHIVKMLDRPNTDPTSATHTFDEYQVDSSYTMYWISGFGVLLGASAAHDAAPGRLLQPGFKPAGAVLFLLRTGAGPGFRPPGAHRSKTADPSGGAGGALCTQQGGVSAAGGAVPAHPRGAPGPLLPLDQRRFSGSVRGGVPSEQQRGGCARRLHPVRRHRRGRGGEFHRAGS